MQYISTFSFGGCMAVSTLCLLSIISFIVSEKKLNKNGQGKQNKTKEKVCTCVQRTTIYNNHIGNQQIDSSRTAYLLMC